jgi:hypothetical protein
MFIACVAGLVFREHLPWPPWMQREYWWQRNLSWITLAEKLARGVVPPAVRLAADLADLLREREM